MLMRYRVTNISNTPGFEGGPRPFFIVEGGRLLNPGDVVLIARIDPGTYRTVGLKVEDLNAPAAVPPPKAQDMAPAPETTPEPEKTIEQDVTRVQSTELEAVADAEPSLELDPTPAVETETEEAPAPKPQPQYTGKRGRRG